MTNLYTRVINKIQPSETTVLILSAIGVGIGTGFGAILFIQLIAGIDKLFFQTLSNPIDRRWMLILIPALGGLLAGPIIAFFAREAKGHGVPEVMLAIATRGGIIRPRVVVAKILASALCIGSGGSAGREGPIVQVGAALGSSIGQWLHLSERRIRNLVACGAAAGIAATFNAPIAGVIFAMEIILGDLDLGDMGNVVISSLTASTLARIFLGDHPAFAIPKYSMKNPWEVITFAMLGMAAAFVSILFIKLLYWFEAQFDHWKFPNALKPSIGGLLLGGLGFTYPLLLMSLGMTSEEARVGLPLMDHIPHIFAAGFDVIESALLGKATFMLLLALILLKPLGTSLTLGSGNSGGVFAPSLFTGAALGGAFGLLLNNLFPDAVSSPGAYAVVGMAAVFAGAARAPFTAILIVFEMTDDYRLIIPLMAGVIVSLMVAERLHKESIYTLKLVGQGVRIQRGRDVDVMEAVRVSEVMVTQPVTVTLDTNVVELERKFLETGQHGFPVIDQQGRLAGVVSLQDYRRALEAGSLSKKKTTVRQIASLNPQTAYSDETIGAVLRRMAPRDLSRLPVVSREDSGRLLGVVRRNDIVRAYELGVLRREEVRRRAVYRTQIPDEETTFIDLTITPDSPAAGKTLAELSLPYNSIIVSIRRGKKLVIPHGDTRLETGDLVTALCLKDNMDEFKNKFLTTV